MILKLAKHFLMKPEGDGGSGGGGTGGAGTGSATGGNSGASAGGNAGGSGSTDALFGEGNSGNSQGNAPTGGTGGTPNPNPSTSGQIASPDDWRQSLPDDLKNDAFIQKYKTPADLAKGYQNLQKHLGADKMVVPKAGTPLAEMREIFERIGLPKADQYKIDFPQEHADKLDDGFKNTFKDLAYNANMLPEQANMVAKFLADHSAQSETQMIEAQRTKITQAMNDFRTEQGARFDQTIREAKAAMNQFLTPQERDYFRAAGAGNDPNFIRLLSKVAQAALSEDTLKGLDAGGQGGTGLMTPGEAKAKIADLKKNISDPYYDKNHAKHAERKAEVNGWYKLAFPDQMPPTNSKDPK